MDAIAVNDWQREATLEYVGESYLFVWCKEPKTAELIEMEKGPDAVKEFQDKLESDRVEMNLSNPTYKCATMGRKEWVAVNKEKQIWICTDCCEFTDRGGKIRGKFPRRASALTWSACDRHEKCKSHQNAVAALQDQ